MPSLNIVLSTIALLTTYWAASYAAREHLPIRYVLIAAAIVSMIWFLYAEISVLRRVDEMQRKIQLEALAIAYPVAIGFLMTLGMLQRTMTLPVDDLSYRHVWPFLVLFYLIGLGISARRYR